MNFLESISQNTLLADGAMGTMLHTRGVNFDKCFDELNLTKPAAVAGWQPAPANTIVAPSGGAAAGPSSGGSAPERVRQRERHRHQIRHEPCADFLLPQEPKARRRRAA